LHARFVHHRYPRHFHDSWTIAHVISGAARFELERSIHTAPEGSVFVIPPGLVHTGEVASSGGYVYRVLYLQREALPGQEGVSVTARRAWMPVVMRDRQLTAALT